MAGFSYRDLKKFSKGKKERSTRKNLNTIRDALVKRNGVVDYYVWGNKIATYNPKKGCVKISSAGHSTNLTKNRLNKVIPRGHISQRKFEWFMKKNGGEVKFKDGMTVCPWSHKKRKKKR